MKVVVIGGGYWGKNLIRIFHELDSLQGIFDPIQETVSEIRARYPWIATYGSLEELLQHPEISAVAIASPSETHYRLAKEALLAGKDVFVEKPLALSWEEGLELAELSKRLNRILMVGHLLEYHPAILKLKALIDDGELGKVHYIYSNRLNLGKIRREENILWSFAPHDISAMLLLLNELPIAVSAHGGSYLQQGISDVTVSILDFQSGVRGHIFVSWLHPYKEQKLIVVGERKMALFNDVSKDEKLVLFRHNIEWKNRIPIPKKEEAEVIPLPAVEPLKEECQHFLDCLRTRHPPKTDGTNGVNVLKVLKACQTSLETGGAIVQLEDNQRRSFAHPTATIDSPSEIGRETQIWHYSHVMKGAKIGEKCRIGQNVFIGSNVKIGNNVKIQNNVSIYEGVILEDDVFCGPSMVFTNIINPRSHIVRKDEYRQTLVKRGATIGANATIVCGVTIGEYAFIGAGALVTKNVSPYALVYGNPARVHGKVCACGVKIEAGKEHRCKQ